MADFDTMVASTSATGSTPTNPMAFMVSQMSEAKKQSDAETKAYQKKLEETRSKVEAQGNDLETQMKRYRDASEKLGPVYQPQYQDVPKAPNQKLQDPTQVLGSLGTVLAIFGSMKTRAPMTSALNSMAAAMKGFHQGDQEAVKLNTEKWQNDFKKAIAQNQIEMEKYVSSLKEHQFDLEKAMPDFRSIAAESDNTNMLQALDQGNHEAVMANINAPLKIGMQAAETFARIDATKQAHADTMIMHKDAQEQAQANRDLARSDMNTRWFIANAQKQVKPYQDTIRKVNDIESNLVPGMEMPDTLKVELKQLAGTRQASKWTQGLDKYTGDIVTRIFSMAERGTLGKLSQQDVDAMKAFTANVKSINAQEIEKVKSSMKPYADQYKIPAPIYDIPFSASGAVGDLGEAYPGMDQSAADALGIAKDMAGGQ